MTASRIIWLIGVAIVVGQEDSVLNEVEMKNRLQLYNSEALVKWSALRHAEWNCSTDIGNDSKEVERLRRSTEVAQFERDKWATTWRNAEISNYSDEGIRQQLLQLRQIGISALDSNDLTKLVRVTTTMTTIYNAAQICPYKQENCNIDTHGLAWNNISYRMAHSRDSDELLYLWKAWHDATGKQMRPHYDEYTNYMNKAAVANGLADATKLWQLKYDDANFTNNIERLWNEVKPLYDDLHTYIKYKLKYIYDKEIDINNENIPAHLFGDMWARNWQNLFHDVKPFKNATLINVSERMVSLNYTPLKMFEVANDFFTSLGLMSAEMSYTPPGIIEKPSDRLIECHPSAWDFLDGKDFRIKMCTNVNADDLSTIHHELGHIQYFMQYKDLPLPLRNGANVGFYEAIGGTIALSAATPQHLLKIGLLDEYKDSPEDNVNALLHEALDRIASLPHSLLVDKWRWDLFSGTVNQTQWNEHWWDLVQSHQKISKPVPRSELDFDAGAKYQVAAGTQYISYFVANILQFQLYKALCIESKQYNPSNAAHKPLHKCDFYDSKAAGQKLANGMKLGASKHWKDILKTMTSESDLQSDAILEYFQPLREFLKKENVRLKLELETRAKLEQYNEQAIGECRKYQLAEWDFITDVNNLTKQNLRSEALIQYSQFKKDAYNELFSKLKPDDFDDESVRRQILFATKLGIGHLNSSRLQEWSRLKSKMENTYGTATFCPYIKPNCDLKSEALSLEPQITRVMATSTDFEELKYTWVQWFNRAGAPMRQDFKQYVAISNEAAALNGMHDYGEFWRSFYEDAKFIDNVKTIWNQVEPLYSRLHEYTRFKLLEIYGNQMDADDPLIPAHLLGNMWAQSWVNLYDRIKPFKEASELDITKGLKSKNYTPLKMFQESDRFYQSLNLEPMEMSYTNLSIIEKPSDRVIICHASAWDFCNGQDFRIKQCTTVDHKNFITIHHEMGHIQYYILYKNQPIIFRTGANPGFHEAIGDLMALSAATPTHLKKINLLEEYNDTAEGDMNALFKMALERVAFLPFGLLIDMYRWDIFSGNVPESKWNAHWEYLREKLQRIRSPEKRTEEHFDAGAKYHVPSDYPYIAYFVSHILEFQLHRSMCLVADEYDPEDLAKPLHKCDIAGSYKVGQRLRDGLSLGASRHWSETLSILTDGETELSADAILEYFEPLDQFLLHENFKMRQLNTSYQHIPVIIGAIICGLFVIVIITYCIYIANRGSKT